MATYTSSFKNPYPDGWKDVPSKDTPIDASALQAHTDALQAIDDYLIANPIPDESGGGSGTTDYNDLDNKPSINGTELSGNVELPIPTKTSDLENDSGFLTKIPEQSYNDLSDKPQINGIDLQGNLTVEELGLLDITESTDTTLENSKDGVLKIKKIYGNTIQDGEPTPDAPVEIESVVLSKVWTCRKNLLKNKATNGTGNGITLTVNADKSITMNGTSTARATFTINTLTLSAGTYVLSQGFISEANSACLIGVYVENGITKYIDLFNDTDGKRNLHFTQDTQLKISVDIRNAGITVNNVTLYPMLEVGTTATEYEPYTESVATLSEPITMNGLWEVIKMV